MRFVPAALMWILIPMLCFAQRSNLKPLSFQADQNNVQILAQRFEYALMDATKLRIGDILIDSAKLKMAFEKNGDNDVLTFRWPAALLIEGRITLLNNNGKAIWAEDFDEKQVQVKRVRSQPKGPEEEDDENGDTRTEVASFTSSALPKQVVDSMKFLPFMNFCVSRESETTKIYVCSEDLFLFTSESGERSIRDRVVTHKESSVVINGKAVSNQGLVYLNDAQEDIFMRAQMESGAVIEIITRKKNIDFRDVLSGDGGKRVVVTARGAQPARKKGVKKLGNDEYQVSLPSSRPYYYVLAEGGIPMRQEFFLRGALPSEEMRPFVHISSPDKTFDSSVELRGVHPAGVAVKSDGPLSEVTPESKNRFSWVIRDLQAGKNRRALAVDPEKGGHYLASYDIVRGRGREADLGAAFYVPGTIGVGQVSYRHWMEDFFALGDGASWSHFHWAWSAGYKTYLTTKPDRYAKFSLFNFGLHYRLNEGFPFIDPSFSMGLLAGSASIEGEGSTALGVEVLHHGEPPLVPSAPGLRSLKWWEYALRVWPASSGSGAKLSLGWEAEVRAYFRMNDNLWVRGGIGVQQFKSNLSLEGEGPQGGLTLGTTYIF